MPYIWIIHQILTSVCSQEILNVGRHQGLPRENIIFGCNQNINVIEEEYHFVVKCSLIYSYFRGNTYQWLKI